MDATDLWEDYSAPAPDEAPQRVGPPSMEAVLEPANVSAAWQRVRHNRGCAGVDGVTITELDPVFEHS